MRIATAPQLPQYILPVLAFTYLIPRVQVKERSSHCHVKFLLNSSMAWDHFVFGVSGS